MLYLLSYVSGLYVRYHRLFWESETEQDRAVQKAFYRELLERVAGIEPASSAWKAEVLPLYHTRLFFISRLYYGPFVQNNNALLMVAGEGFEPSKA